MRGDHLGPFGCALFGAICWGLAPIFGKLGLKGVRTFDGLAARTFITVLLVTGWLLGSGSYKRITTFHPRTWFFLAIEAFLATFAGDLAYYAALKNGEVGQTALVLASSPLVTFCAGFLFLQEKITFLKTLGAAFIFIGIILMAINSS
ncbi:MAG TPA: transporter [Firmicutes bacterium]|nr:transporter [Bacillota bacterium]